MDLGTRLTIFLRGRLVGNDAVGDRYYLEKSQRRGRLRARRWVVYATEKEASAVPAEWHGRAGYSPPCRHQPALPVGSPTIDQEYRSTTEPKKHGPKDDTLSPRPPPEPSVDGIDVVFADAC